MKCDYKIKVINGRLCMRDAVGWKIVTADMIFRAGIAFNQRGPFPPIKFN